MILLRGMKEEEFSEFRDYFIVDYGVEIAANYGRTPDEGRELAAKELTEDLPQGVLTLRNHLRCIVDDDSKTIGYLWYRLVDDDASAFIFDFVVFSAYRRLGYGKSALTALEQELLQNGVTQIKLRVAYKNSRALALYERVGYSITGYNMAKRLS